MEQFKELFHLTIPPTDLSYRAPPDACNDATEPHAAIVQIEHIEKQDVPPPSEYVIGALWYACCVVLC